MLVAFVIINTLIFFTLSMIHVYWAAGGRWGTGSVLPSVPDGEVLFTPKIYETLIVATGLMLFALVTVGHLAVFDHILDRKIIKYASIAIALIFIARAVGDFKYLGFFKKIKGTEFADKDSRFFSPLCLFLGISSLLMLYLQ